MFLLGYLKVSKLKRNKREHAFQNASQRILYAIMLYAVSI